MKATHQQRHARSAANALARKGMTAIPTPLASVATVAVVLRTRNVPAVVSEVLRDVVVRPAAKTVPSWRKALAAEGVEIDRNPGAWVAYGWVR